MQRPTSAERPLKRQKSCIDYCVHTSIEVSEQIVQDESETAGSPMSKDIPLADALPSKTPAVGLLPTGLLPTSGGRAAAQATSAAVGKVHLGTSLLQSLQRRFVQQSLETPMELRSAERTTEERPPSQPVPDEDLDGFVLHSQPCYERVLSQRGGKDGNVPPTPPSQPQADSLFGDDGLLNPSAAAPAAEQVLVTCERPARQGELARGLRAVHQYSAPAEASGHTPAVHSVDRVQLNSSTAGGGGRCAGVFPIFRSKRDCKVLYIVRHGESEYNEAVSRSGSKWEDPIIFDAPLTKRGRAQARDLRADVGAWRLPEDTVWITSPLSRAIETMLIARQGQGMLHLGGGGGFGEASFGNVHVRPEISERLMTSGDIGRRPSDLCARFPQLQEQLVQLAEAWWYDPNPINQPNCAYRQEFKSSEPKPHMQRRIKGFRKWLLERPEKTFVAVGHSLFWKEFAATCKNGAKNETLKNCGWMVLYV